MTQDEGIPYQRHKPSAAFRAFLDPLDPGAYFDCGRARLPGLDDALLREAESRGRKIGDDSFQLVATDMGLIFCRPSISFAIAARWDELLLIRPSGEDPVVLPITWPTHGELKFTVSKRLAGNIFRRWLQLRMQADRLTRTENAERFTPTETKDGAGGPDWEVVEKVERPVESPSTRSAAEKRRRRKTDAGTAPKPGQGRRRRGRAGPAAESDRTPPPPPHKSGSAPPPPPPPKSGPPPSPPSANEPVADPAKSERSKVGPSKSKSSGPDPVSAEVQLLSASQPDPVPEPSGDPSPADTAVEPHPVAPTVTAGDEGRPPRAKTQHEWPTAAEQAAATVVLPGGDMVQDVGPGLDRLPRSGDEPADVDTEPFGDGGPSDNPPSGNVDALAGRPGRGGSDVQGAEPQTQAGQGDERDPVRIEVVDLVAAARGDQPPPPQTSSPSSNNRSELQWSESDETPPSWIGSPLSSAIIVVALSTIVLIISLAVGSYRRSGEPDGIGDPAGPGIGSTAVGEDLSGEAGGRAVGRTTIDHQRYQPGAVSSEPMRSVVITPDPDSAVTTSSSQEGEAAEDPAARTRPRLCNSNYSGCVADVSDVDCPGDGDGPVFSEEPAVVMGEDIYELDTDGDGETCEPDQPLRSELDPPIEAGPGS